MTVRPPRDHHYIPKFYQRPWAGDDGRVERYTRVPSGIHCRRDFPSAVAYEPDLYRHPSPKMEEWSAQQLEWAILSKIDDAAATALDALLFAPGALRDGGVRRDWSIFLRSMLLRTPYQMAGTLASLEQIWRDADGPLSKKYATMRTPGMPETATEFLESLNPNEAKERSFEIFAESMGSDRTTRHIMKQPWRIFDCSSSDHRLVLSDHSVVLVPLETDDGHVAMPLSPTKLLIVATSERTKALSDTIRPKLAVRIMNKLTVQRAQHYVIASDRKQDVFIRKHFGCNPVPPFLGPDKLAPKRSRPNKTDISPEPVR